MTYAIPAEDMIDVREAIAQHRLALELEEPCPQCEEGELIYSINGGSSCSSEVCAYEAPCI